MRDQEYYHQTIASFIKQYIKTWAQSEGSRVKWKEGSLFYKRDDDVGEGLAEVIASRILAKSNITDFVTYHYERKTPAFRHGDISDREESSYAERH